MDDLSLEALLKKILHRTFAYDYNRSHRILMLEPKELEKLCKLLEVPLPKPVPTQMVTPKQKKKKTFDD